MKQQPITEGITYNATDDSFYFDFQGNSEYSIIEFNDLPLEPVKFGIDSVYYFGYQFNNNAATSQIRTKFFNALRYGTIVLPKEAKQQFILNALDKLNKQINIWSFDVLVYPESRSDLNSQLIRSLTNFVRFKSILTIMVAKNISKNDRYTSTIMHARNILLIDDVATTGATIMEALKSIRCINQTAKIVIFTLVGKRDLG